MGEVFETSDIQAAERALSDAYGNMRITVRGQRRGMRLSQVSLIPAVRLDHVTFAMSFDATADPPGALVVGELKSGLEAPRFGGDSILPGLLTWAGSVSHGTRRLTEPRA
jgi:hypothetical protein